MYDLLNKFVTKKQTQSWARKSVDTAIVRLAFSCSKASELTWKKQDYSLQVASISSDPP